jgi:hypothetical protein
LKSIATMDIRSINTNTVNCTSDPVIGDLCGLLDT